MLNNLEVDVKMMCPVCKGTDFNFKENKEDITCTKCGRKTTKSDLIRDNQRYIDSANTKMKEKAVKEVTQEFEKMMKNAFKGNKNITLR